MNELALQQQRTIDRIALAGSLIAALAAAAFIALDPVQTVARRLPAPAAHAAPVAAAPIAALPEASPVRTVTLPTPTWFAVSDGTWSAYARLETGEPAEIVVRSLATEDWHVAYRAAPGSFIGQLSLAGGLLAFEELVPASDASVPARVAVRTLRIDTGERATVDEYVPLDLRYGEGGGYESTSPVTDGERVFWVHQTAVPEGGVANEIRVLDLETGTSRTVFERTASLGTLSVWRDTLAFTRSTSEKSAAFTLDLATGEARSVDGFDYSAVQSIGPAGVVVTGGSLAGSAASWLVRADGSRSRLASDCYNVVANDRLMAMRCATQIQIRDLATGASLYRFAGDAGGLSIFPNGVVWAEGDSLLVYRVPAIPRAEGTRPE